VQGQPSVGFLPRSLASGRKQFGSSGLRDVQQTDTTSFKADKWGSKNGGSGDGGDPLQMYTRVMHLQAPAQGQDDFQGRPRPTGSVFERCRM
jgi:hypothetical protein